MSVKPLFSFSTLSILLMFSACSAATMKQTQLTQQTQLSASEQSKPNILLIVADDQGYGDLGSTGLSRDVNTPNLDKLASKGTRFTQAYATSPICNTSRAGLLTGRYTQRFGGYWYGGKGLEQANEQTLAEALKVQGYATGYVGKFHFGTSHQPGSRNFPTDHGFDSFYGFSGGRKHYLIHNQAAENAFQQNRKAHNKKGEGLEMGPVWLNESKVDQQGFSTELIGQHANQFIVENKTKPFFLQVSFNAIHNFTHQLPVAYLKEQGLNGYHDWDPATENFRDWYVGGRYPNNPEGRAYYLGQLHFLDVEIGRILAQLEQQGLMDNTIVVYLGDNGGSTPIYANNGPLRGSKYTLYEGGIRVPMIIYGAKQYQHAKVVTDVVSAMDIYPTVLSAAGIEIPNFLDGEDITPLISSASDTGADNNLAVRTLVWDSGHEIAVRRGKWKYRAAFDDYYAVKQMVELELGEYLYDLDNDPGESNNLIGKYPQVVAQLKGQYLQWAKANVEPKKLSKTTKANRLKAGI